MCITIIVEGKNDKSRLRRLLTEDITILCTFGSLNTERLESLKKQADSSDIFYLQITIPPAKKSAPFYEIHSRTQNKYIPEKAMQE